MDVNCPQEWQEILTSIQICEAVFTNRYILPGHPPFRTLLYDNRTTVIVDSGEKNVKVLGSISEDS